MMDRYLAKLDALVHSHPLSSTPGLAPVASTTPGAAANSAPTAVTKENPKPGFLGRAKVLLTPGTEVEYSTLDAMLLPPFEGWEKGTVLKLSNGQRWRVTSSASYSAKSRTEPGLTKIDLARA